VGTPGGKTKKGDLPFLAGGFSVYTKMLGKLPGEGEGEGDKKQQKKLTWPLREFSQSTINGLREKKKKRVKKKRMEKRRERGSSEKI